jgi:hypothetical protein
LAQVGICGFGLPQDKSCVVFYRGGIIVYYAKHRIETEILCVAENKFLTFLLQTCNYFLKEDYYV